MIETSKETLDAIEGAIYKQACGDREFLDRDATDVQRIEHAVGDVKCVVAAAAAMIIEEQRTTNARLMAVMIAITRDATGATDGQSDNQQRGGNGQ